MVSTSAFVILSMAIAQAVMLPVQCTVDSTLHWVIACLIILHDTCWTCWVGTSMMTISGHKLIFLCHLFVPNLFVRCPCVCTVWCDDAKVRADCNTAQIEIGNEFSSALKKHFTPLGYIKKKIMSNALVYENLNSFGVKWFGTEVPSFLSVSPRLPVCSHDALTDNKAFTC